MANYLYVSVFLTVVLKSMATPIEIDLSQKTVQSDENYGNQCAKIPSWMKNSFLTYIVGGQEAPYPIPWQVYLSGIGCGGTILDKYTILTAAHCLNDFPTLPNPSIYIKAGITHHNASGPNVQNITVKEYIIHPHYQQRELVEKQY